MAREIGFEIKKCVIWKLKQDQIMEVCQPTKSDEITKDESNDLPKSVEKIELDDESCKMEEDTPEKTE